MLPTPENVAAFRAGERIKNEIRKNETAFVYYFDEESGEWMRAHLFSWENDPAPKFYVCHEPLKEENGTGSNN